MRYSLRTLLIVVMVAPPVLAVVFIWFRDHASVGLVVVLAALALRIWLDYRHPRPGAS